MTSLHAISSVFFFNDTATTEIYTLSLHDALPIFGDDLLLRSFIGACDRLCGSGLLGLRGGGALHHLGNEFLLHLRSEEHTSNSSHANISYAVFCLKKKKQLYHLLYSYSPRSPHMR